MYSVNFTFLQTVGEYFVNLLSIEPKKTASESFVLT